MTTSEINETLKASPLFKEFTADEISSLVDLLDPEDIRAGECIVRQDDVGDSMYLLVEGSARVVHHTAGRDIELAIMRPLDFFGELALVDHGPRSADVEAVEDSLVLKISQSAITALAGVYPMAAIKFLIALGRLMVERLRNSNRRYIDSLMFPLHGKD